MPARYRPRLTEHAYEYTKGLLLDGALPPGSRVRVEDVGQAVDSVEDIRQSGYLDSKPSVLLVVFRQPGANIINTVDNVRAALPQLQSAIPHCWTSKSL